MRTTTAQCDFHTVEIRGVNDDAVSRNDELSIQNEELFLLTTGNLYSKTRSFVFKMRNLLQASLREHLRVGRSLRCFES